MTLNKIIEATLAEFDKECEVVGRTLRNTCEEYDGSSCGCWKKEIAEIKSFLRSALLETARKTGEAVKVEQKECQNPSCFGDCKNNDVTGWNSALAEVEKRLKDWIK